MEKLEVPQASVLSENTPAKTQTSLKPWITRLAAAAMLLAIPQSVDSAGISKNYDRMVKGLKYDAPSLPVGLELIQPGSIYRSRRDDISSGFICEDCCDNKAIQARVANSVESFEERREIDNKMITSLTAGWEIKPGVGVSEEVATEFSKITDATLKIKGAEIHALTDSQIRDKVYDPICMSGQATDKKKIWVVTHVLVGTPTFTFKDETGQKIDLETTGIPYVNPELGWELKQTSSGKFEATKPLVIGYHLEKFDRVKLSPQEALMARDRRDEKREECTEKMEEYCEDKAKVQKENTACEAKLKDQQAGSMNVTWTRTQAEWVDSNPVCSKVHFPAVERKAYTSEECEASSPDRQYCAEMDTIHLGPEEEKRLVEPDDIKALIKVTGKVPDQTPQWTIETTQVDGSGALIKVLNYGPAFDLELCVPQEELESNGALVNTHYFKWGEETKVLSPKIGSSWEANTRYVSSGVTVDGPYLGEIPPGITGVSRSTSTLTYMGEGQLQDLPQKEQDDLLGSLKDSVSANQVRYLRYEPSTPPCTIQKEPKAPKGCNNCGDLPECETAD